MFHSLERFDLFVANIKVDLVGLCLMVLQQFGGVNGTAFYASAIFISAGKKRIVYLFFSPYLMLPIVNKYRKLNRGILCQWQGFQVILGP